MFDLPDELFVNEAYLLVLGRTADPIGYQQYLRRLRRGLSRVSMIGALQASDEARSPRRSPSTRQHVAADVWPGRRLRGFRRMRFSLTSRLLKLRDAVFVETACEVVLGRPATAAERTSCLAAASTEHGRRELLVSMLQRKRSGLTSLPWCIGLARSGVHAEQRPPPPAVRDRTTSTVTSWHQNAASSGTGLFTIATSSYLPFVRVLMKSVREHQPDFNLFLLLVDDDAAAVESDACWTTVLARDLRIATFDDMCLRYNVTELCTALKPFFFRWLLEQTSLTALIYLDPDTRLYAPMQDVTAVLDAGSSLVLTPHLTRPLPDDTFEPSEHTILKAGVFNLGFAAIRRSGEALAFLIWWSERLKTDAIADVGRNLFTDQRWCDMAPALVPDLTILRDHGYNVAYWNLCQREVRSDDTGGWHADSRPLVLFHFSGFDPTAPHVVSKYQNRLRWDDIPAMQRLFLDYAGALLAAGWQECVGSPYPYDAVAGVRISGTLRRLYGGLYSAPMPGSREELFQQLAGRCVVKDQQGMTVMMRHLHASRADVARSFDLETSAGRHAYHGWFWSAGIIDHGLSDFYRFTASAATTLDHESHATRKAPMRS